MPNLLPLNLVKPGSKASIHHIQGQPSMVQRMRELGLRNGCEIEVLRQGCPCIVRCRGSRYCLRGNDCTCVMVRVDKDDDTR